MVNSTSSAFSELADLKQGVIEAATIYQPCLNKDLEAKDDPSTNPVIQEKRKTMQTIILSANVGTIMNNEELSEEMWGNWTECEEEVKGGNPPLTLLSDANDLEFTCRVAVEALGRLVDATVSDLAERNDRLPAGREPSKGMAVWVLGTETGMDYKAHGLSAYERLQALFDRHVENNPDVALVVVLAAETRIDIVETTWDSVDRTARPFPGFWKMWDSWRTKRLKAASGKGHKHGPAPGRGRAQKKSKAGTFLHVGARNLAVLEWTAFSEVFAQHYNEKTQKFALPRKSEIRDILMRYMDEASAIKVAALVEEEDEVADMGPQAHGQDEGQGQGQGQEGGAGAGGDKAKASGGKGRFGSMMSRLRGKKADAKAAGGGDKKAVPDGDVIEGYSELREMKARFVNERRPLFMAELKAFIGAFVSVDAVKKTEHGEKDCTTGTCVVA